VFSSPQNRKADSQRAPSEDRKPKKAVKNEKSKSRSPSTSKPVASRQVSIRLMRVEEIC